jgi:hypothetical protein
MDLPAQVVGKLIVMGTRSWPAATGRVAGVAPVHSQLSCVSQVLATRFVSSAGDSQCSGASFEVARVGGGHRIEDSTL